MKPTYETKRFGDGVLPNVQDISRLHAELLPRSPITLLGPRFRERFYYADLPELGCIFGSVAYFEGSPAGFVSATSDSDGFMKAAMRRRGHHAILHLAVAVLTDPRCLGVIREVNRIQAGRDQKASGGHTGEILSAGVLREFRGRCFRERTGVHIGLDLVSGVLKAFQEAGISAVRAIVDDDNLPALRFYQKLGFEQCRTNVPGWRTVSTEVVWRPAAGKLSQEARGQSDGRV